MILAACFAASAALMASCTGGNTGKTSAGSESVSSSEEEFDGWTPDNILSRPVEKDDIRFHRQRARNGNALLLSAGELARIGVDF